MSVDERLAAILNQNPWQLYSSMEGWEGAEAALNAALAAALGQADQSVAAGQTLPEAAWGAVQAMGPALRAQREFGAVDPECHHYLCRQVRKHFQARYGVRLEVD